MSRFRGVVGFMQTVEDPNDPSSSFEQIVETPKLYGDILTNKWNKSNGEYLIDNFTIGNRVSVVCNQLMQRSLRYARYIVIEGTKWEITSVDIEPPRLIFTLGGIYNDRQTIAIR